MKTALVIGATGLTGSELVKQLLDDPQFDKVIVFVRRETGISHPKFTERIIDFNNPESWQDLVDGDVLFSCLGTTIKKAGSRDAQWKIDHTYQFRFAEIAAKNGVPCYVLISSAGADSGSGNFYLRMKGSLEDDVQKLPFRKCIIIRPGLLSGDRKESRPGEKWGEIALRIVNAIGLFKQYRPIPADSVAQAMIVASGLQDSGTIIYQPEEVFKLQKS
jgi:uncharacterized protein YbjT (DUF2867 family)